MSMQEIDNIEVQNSSNDIYGSFYLNGCEFAICANHIQEVVNEEQHYTHMPLSPDYLMGLFNLRGLVVPVIDLQKIFKMNSAEYNKTRKIAIIEYGAQLIGLIFDVTGEVFNAKRVNKDDYIGEKKDASPLIKGVFKFNEGKRIIQIIDPMQIANLKEIPKLNEELILKKRKKPLIRHKCISFKVGNAICAIQIESIQEVLRVNEIELISFPMNFCLGAIKLRGIKIPIVDFSAMLGYSVENSSGQSNYTIIVLKVEDAYFGLSVASVNSIVSYFNEDVVSFPVMSQVNTEMIAGCINIDGEINTILLDHKKILSNQEIEDIATGFKRLFNKRCSETELADQKQMSKNTYILFTIRKQYALEITQVCEVFDCPEELIHPPNFPDHFKGVINLRGDLISIIDPKVLYTMEAYEQSKLPKLLIFKSENKRYGILVDSVDSILTFAQNKRIRMPTLLFQNNERDLYNDIMEVVEVKQNEEDKVVLILDPAKIVNNVN